MFRNDRVTPLMADEDAPAIKRARAWRSPFRPGGSRTGRGRLSEQQLRRVEVDLSHLSHLVATGEPCAVTRTAEGLRLAGPGLSTQMRGLEAELGAGVLVPT
jgi:hypothetical protein